MARLTDGSERIRIKVDVANKLREMSTGLNMSFLEVLYYAVNTFYLHHYNEIKNGSSNSKSQVTLPVETEAITDNTPKALMPDSDDTCEIDLGF
jgi:hypothetical protein